MGIRVLSDAMINLVAAGEVVERPASVVKELVENSIDAKSKNIIIEIKNGGKKLIQVSDDGLGIPRNDVRLAFISHATSKIFSESDLEKILTLGFRGEALASIAIISKLDLITYFKNESCGTHYKISGGEEIFLKDCAQRKGSVFSVKDIFYNTPARMKFLKQDTTEGNFIASAVNHMILSHPEISFKFIRDNKQIISSIGDGKISSAVLRVFGKDFFENLIEINYNSSLFFINGFIGNPNLKNTKSRIQHFFINGRFVKSKIISNAIEIALESECQNIKIPSVLYLKMPPEFVDVNVHPAKTEVRFASEKLIFELVYNSVKNAIMINQKKLFALASAKTYEKKIITESESNFLHDNINLPKLSEKYFDKKIDTKEIKQEIFEQKLDNNKINQEQKSNIIEPKNFIEEIENNVKIIGEVFNCFLLVEYKNELILVDKHAAHERIIFENLNKNNFEKSSQILLSSITVNLSIKDYDLILNNLENLQKIGYDIEDFGPGKFIIRAIPVYLEEKDIQNSLFEIAEFLSKNKSDKNFENLKKIYSQIACKSAIKAGKASFLSEIKELIKKLIETKITNCPHGRPIYFSVSKDDIYKKFLRK
ncbi:MAG: DNA mismatch repair endonuclease MutL [Clostridia bacterium]|nr:DNA mismatch repair endonuclease MutL [Clostridia bacterium]